MTQWHPLFTELLRSVVERHYEVQTNLPVGDAPRQADIVLLRRKSSPRPPFHGLWKDLTAWNVVEFKGPTVSARLDDLDELVELGLGIHRRLNEERAKRKDAPLGPPEMSWWYLANHLGRRFLADAPRWLGPLQPAGAGVWRCVVMQRAVYLVSRTGLPVEQESLPLHALVQGSPETVRAVAQIVSGQPTLLERYGPIMMNLHPNFSEEFLAMVKSTDDGPSVNMDGLVRVFGLRRIVDSLGVHRVVREYGIKRVADEIGWKSVVEELGPEVVQKMAPDDLLASLTPAQKRALKRRLS